LSVTVRNIGPLASGDGFLAIRLDSAGGEELVEVALPALESGQSTTLEVDVDTTDREGVLDLVAVADSREEIGEVDEDDNVSSVRVTLHAGPDLAVFGPDLSTAPETPGPDESFNLLVQVRNLGEAEVASFGYRVSRLVAGMAVEVLASGSAGPLEAGGARLVTVPLQLAEDEHTVEVVVDPDGLVEEESESNNRSTLSFFVVDPSRPDLAVLEGDVALTPAEPSPGETATASVTVRNLGEEEATAQVVLHENGLAGVELARETVTVAAGGSVSVAPSFVVGEGAFALTAVVDPDGQVLEADESNNLLTLVFRDLPDLAIGFDNFELSSLSPSAGDPVDVTVTVRNAGTASAAGVELEVLAGEGGTPVFTHTFAEIPAAANRQARFTWTAAEGLTALVARVDGGGAIVERSETNNASTREVAVPRATGPDLRVGAIDRVGLVESAGELAISGSVTVEIVNAGDADVTEPFEVRLFEDRDGDGRRGGGDPVLASTVIESGVPSGAATVATLAVAGAPAFFHSLVWLEVDAGDVVAEQREDDNRAALYGDCEV
ncbi:MAG TPA: CARDB domain-containing protein, partial [Thermoanaerobaculia bacterium]